MNQCEFPVKLLERKVRSKPHILHVNKALLLLLLITIPKPKGRSFDPFNGQLHCRVLSIFFSLESVTNCTPARRGLCCKMGSDKVNYLLWKILFLRENASAICCWLQTVAKSLKTSSLMSLWTKVVLKATI